MEYKVNINGLEVKASYSQKSIDDIFVPLIKRLEEMQNKKGKRILVMLAAPPAAGKSTLCSFLQFLAKEKGL